MADWRGIIQDFYPNLLEQTYCVPPIHFNQVPFKKQSIAGQSFLLTQPLLNSDSNRSGQPVQSGQPSQSRKKRRSAKGKPKLSPAGTVPSHPPTERSVSPMHQDASAQACQSPPLRMWGKDFGSIPQTSVVFESDTREDIVQQHVLGCLQELGERQKEVMFIVSQMNFANILDKPCYSAAVQDLPKPLDLPEGYRRGDCDILIIHRHYGILVGEIKSVGMKASTLEKSEVEMDSDIVKRLKRATEQLDKSEKVIRHIVKDIAADVAVMKTVILPYVSRSQLHRILQANTDVEEMLCQSIGAEDRERVVELCICSEQLSHPATPWDVTPAVLSELDTWFQRRVKAEVDASMSDEAYIDIVARVAGPATSVTVHCVSTPRVEVRTLEQAISQCGERLSQLVLTPTQLGLLQTAPRIVCLTGPPGTGKSILLIIVGLMWLRKGFDVHVVCVRSVNLAASQLICHQLRMTLGADSKVSSKVGKVHLHEFHVDQQEEEVKRVVETLVEVAGEGRRLHVLMDEILLGDSLLPSALGSRVYHIIKELSARIEDLHLWAASMFCVTVSQDLHVEHLTEPLRCSPVVLREVLPGVKSNWYSEKVLAYTPSSTPSPFDGPKVIRLSHGGESHTGEWPVGCFKCGLDVGNLLHHLNVGKAAGSPATTCPLGEECSSCAKTCPPALQYRDVFVLTRSSELCDGDDMSQVESGNVSDAAQHASAFVLGLRSIGIPVSVIGRKDTRSEWARKVSEMSLSLKDQVTATHFSAVLGMERKVVVYLPGRKHAAMEEQTEEQIDAADRVLAMSRCTGQLIMIDVPQSPDAKE